MIDNIYIEEMPASAPIFSITPTDLNFGPVALGNSASQQVTVTNSGNIDLIINNITSSDPQFTISPAAFPVTITQGQDQVFSIDFTPTNRALKLQLSGSHIMLPDLHFLIQFRVVEQMMDRQSVSHPHH